MLFPDRASLVGNTRAHQWTYNDEVRLEHLVERGFRGFEGLIDELCETVWGGPDFLNRNWMGTVPKEQAPNLLIAYPQPALAVVGTNGFLALFTDRQRAEAYRQFLIGADRLHLAELRPVRSEPPSFALSVSHWKDDPSIAQVQLTDIYVLVDPVNLNFTAEGSLNVVASNYEAKPFAEFVEQFRDQVLSVPVAAVGNVDRLFVWRVPKE
jgi:hypothetical protein